MVFLIFFNAFLKKIRYKKLKIDIVINIFTEMSGFKKSEKESQKSHGNKEIGIEHKFFNLNFLFNAVIAFDWAGACKR
jgi:hypothetical protein